MLTANFDLPAVTFKTFGKKVFWPASRAPRSLGAAKLETDRDPAAIQ